LGFGRFYVNKATDGSLVTGPITYINGLFRLKDIDVGDYILDEVVVVADRPTSSPILQHASTPMGLPESSIL